MSDHHETSQATIKPREDGPYRVDGLRVLLGADGGRIRVEGRGKGNIALCRCGASGAKPFCDGSHREVAFDTAPPRPGETPLGIAGPADRARGPVGAERPPARGRGNGVQ
ncbi:MAG: CDGSH iron-sulfur domain-containing protein, partial [Acidobacteriota bacterium]